MMSIYAWKITASDKAAIEGITTLEGLEKALAVSNLPLTRSPNEIVTQTRLMEHEGQGVYKHNVEGERWTLLWVALR
jgi:hypothetical protein